MRMLTYAANKMREIDDFVNQNGIPKDNIVDIFQGSDGMFYISYFVED